MDRFREISVVLMVLCSTMYFIGCSSHATTNSAVAVSSTPTSSPTPRAIEPAYGSEDRTDSDSQEENEAEANDESNEEDDLEAEGKHFHGYRCLDDCSGHEAGYKWAEEHDIDDVGRCGGNSQSFIEGCMAWVEDNY